MKLLTCLIPTIFFISFFISCGDDPVSPQNNENYKIPDSLIYPGNPSSFSIWSNDPVGISFSLKTNDTDSSFGNVCTWIQILFYPKDYKYGQFPEVIADNTLYGKNCNGDFGYGGSRGEGTYSMNIGVGYSVWADTTKNYHITMYNIKVSK